MRFHPARPPFSLPAADGTGPDLITAGRALIGLGILLGLACASGGALFRLKPGATGTTAPGAKPPIAVPITVWLAAGMVLIANASWLLAALGVLRWYTLAPLALAPLAFARPSPSLLRIRLKSTPDGILLALPALIVFLLVLLRSFAPATANDAMVYHLEIARIVAESGKHALPIDSIYGHMPHLGSLAYASAWLFGGEGAALLLRFAALAGLAATAARVGGILAPEGRGFAPVALLLVCAHPILLDSRTFGNVDLFGALLFLLAAEQILRRDIGRTPGANRLEPFALLPAGIFAGAFLSIKLSNVFLMPILAALFWIHDARHAQRATLASLARFLLWSAIPVVPWLVRNLMTNGHILFPVVPGDSPVWDAALAERLRAWQLSMGMGRTPADFLLLPYRLFFEGNRGYLRFDGIVHPILLLALIPAAWHGGARTRGALAAGVAGIWLWAVGPQQVRFFLPCLFLLAGMAGWDWLPARGTKLRYGIVAFLLISSGAALFGPARELARDTVPVVAGSESRESYRARQVQSHEALRNIARVVPPGETVLFLWENRLFGLDRPHIADSFFEASQIAHLAEVSGSTLRFAERMATRNVRWVAVNRSLERVFGREYPDETMGVLNGYVAGLEPVGAWKGIELYRVPGPTR